MELFVQYNSICTHDYHSGEEYGDWETDYDFTVQGVVKNSRGRWSGLAHDEELFNVCFDAESGDTLYVLWMTYRTGDSFGSSSGNGEIVWVFKDQHRAHEARRAILEDQDQFTIAFKDDDNNEIEFTNPGSGYFESIQQLEVSEFILEN